MPARALVTGAAGFLGAVLARRLVDDGVEVHADTRTRTDAWRLEGVGVHRHELDLADGSEVRRVVRRVQPEWIFHFAAHGGTATQTDWRRMVEANVIGTMHLVESAIETGFDALVSAGSSSEYGYKDHAPAENESAEPNSEYAVTKLSQTSYCRFAARKHDVHMPTLRLYSVYGPFEEPARFVPTLIAHGLEKRLPHLVSPDVARDFVFTEDVVDAFLAAARKTDAPRGAVYNVGTGTQTTIAQAVAIARELFEIADEPSWGSMPDRKWDTTTWVANVDGIDKELGWKARTGFREGFERFTEWIREHPAPYRHSHVRGRGR